MMISTLTNFSELLDLVEVASLGIEGAANTYCETNVSKAIVPAFMLEKVLSSEWMSLMSVCSVLFT